MSTATTVPSAKASRAQKAAELRQNRARRAAALLKHASEPTRISILVLLAEGENHVGGLSEALNVAQPVLSHHLAMLRHGGIVAPRRAGKNVFYGLTETGADLAQVIKTVMP